MKIAAVLFFQFFLAFMALAQPPSLGKWKSMDETTDKPKFIVEFIERNGKIYGKIIRIFTKPGENPDPVCDKCSKEDIRYNKKIIGMEIITEMVKNGKEYVHGDILDPDTGKVYRCKMWMEDHILKVRGYFGPFYRTQSWATAQ